MNQQSKGDYILPQNDRVIISRSPSEHFRNMNQQSTSRVLVGLLALFVWFYPAAVSAQVPPAQTATPPVSIGTPTPIPPAPQATPSEQPASTSPESEVVYGLQGVLVETLDGKTVASQSEAENFNPASAIKLATALVALKTFGP